MLIEDGGRFCDILNPDVLGLFQYVSYKINDY